VQIPARNHLLSEGGQQRLAGLVWGAESYNLSAFLALETAAARGPSWLAELIFGSRQLQSPNRWLAAEIHH
jgi:hypothetical protein